MTNKLWQTTDTPQLHPSVETYTIGNDYLLDQKLLGYDIEASKAHAQMLHSVGLLTNLEASKLTKSLDTLHDEWSSGKFVVQKQHEDGHTAIETYLIEILGDIGKKIHTGRSRNDQALVMMRLYLKDNLQKISAATNQTIQEFKKAAEKAGNTPMPGYTHMQKAMPTTVDMWLLSYADGFADAKALIDATQHIIDQNPLGSAAGFGISIGLDRNHTTKTLGFRKNQDNPMYCGLSRGLFELITVQALNPLMILAGKFAHDMMMFTSEEFGFFSLPNSFTTGSSIMPHKHNYDLFEVMRGHAHIFGSYTQQLQTISSGVGSGYHRDLQLTKGITLNAIDVALSTLEILNLAIPKLQMHKDNLKNSITEEINSVSEINKLVEAGIPFRDAYVQVKATLDSQSLKKNNLKDNI